MHVLVVPKASMPPSPVPWPAETILKELKLSKLAVTDPSNLAHHLAALFSPSVSELELPQALGEAVRGPNAPTQLGKDDVRFAELVSFERKIPFEESPLSLESLANLATTASGAGVGVYLGFVVFGSSPLLFIAVPAGIVLCCVARGIGQGLEEGLRDRIRDWLKGEKGQKTVSVQTKPARAG
jgi:hypothetical protein